MIQFDAATESNGDGDTGIVEPFDHTTTSYPNRIMFVALGHDNLDDHFAGATYAGVAISQFAHLTVDAARLWVGYLLNPASGTNAVNFAWSPSVVTKSRGLAITFYNVDQTTPIGQDANDTNQNETPTDHTLSITPDGDQGMLVDFYFGTRAVDANAKSPQTEAINVQGLWSDGGGGVDHILGCSYLAHTGSATDMTWENLTHESSNADQYHVAIELIENAFVPLLQII